VRLDEITERIATAITALDASDYEQDASVTPAWTESRVPLDPMFDPESTSHLGFSVLVRGAPVTAQRRGTTNEVIRCGSRVDVMFSYRLRPTEQVGDQRLAMRAALDLCRTVNAEALWQSDEEVIVTVRERFLPRMQLDEQYLLVQTGFEITHDEEV
jgi:hypothetical protein